MAKTIKMDTKQAQAKFMQGLLKLPVYQIEGKTYILVEDIGKLSDRTFGKVG